MSRREDFEKWAKDQGYKTELHALGDYQFQSTAMAWHGYSAGRDHREDPTLPKLLDALGWQGGTVAQAIEEVRRLRGQVRDVYVYLDGIDMANPMEGHFQALHNIVRPIGAPVPQPVLGQGVAALLPDRKD